MAFIDIVYQYLRDIFLPKYKKDIPMLIDNNSNDQFVSTKENNLLGQLFSLTKYEDESYDIRTLNMIRSLRTSFNLDYDIVYESELESCI
jgi:hypothetical protein